MPYKYLLLIAYLFTTSSYHPQSDQEFMVISGYLYAIDQTGQPRYVETTLEHPLHYLEWSPDGSRYTFTVFGDDGNSIWIGNRDGAYSLTERYDSIRGTWSNNHTLLTTVLAFEVPTQINEAHSYALDLDTYTYQQYSKGVPTYILPLPSSEQWIEFGTSPEAILYHLNGEKETLEKVRIEPWTQGVDVSPDGSRLIVCGRHRDTDVFGLYEVSLAPDQRGEVRVVYKTNSCDYSRWSPDGNYLSLRGRWGVEILDGNSYAPLKLIPVDNFADKPIVWAPDSQSLVISTFYDGEESDQYTPVEHPYKTKWRDLTRIYIDTAERVRLTRSKEYEIIEAWRLIPAGAFPLK